MEDNGPKYHVTPDGFFRICTAQAGNCPLGDAHFPSMEAAARSTFAPAGLVPQNASRPTGPTVPFGKKYRDQPVSEMLKDKAYCSWLVKQDEFAMTYPKLFKQVRDSLKQDDLRRDFNRLGQRAK